MELEDRAISFEPETVDEEQMIRLYRQLIRPRMIEEKMLLKLRQGKITKWFAGIGQEAISVGCTAALHQDEYIFTMHRNLGVFTTREVPLDRLFAQWQGKTMGFTKGRDRSFHFGIPDHHIVGMISHLGPQLSLGAGTALAHKLNGEQKVSLAFTGEGGTSEGEFHEALNVASVWSLPVIFVIENNKYGLSTPVDEQYRVDKLVKRAEGYGMEGRYLDGNNVLEVYRNVSALAEDIRQNPRPVLLECDTFRMRGHEEASGTKYVPDELFDQWEKRDPVRNYELYLLENNHISEQYIETFKEETKREIEEALETAFDAPEPEADKQRELGDVYAPSTAPDYPPSDEREDIRFVDAVSDGLRESMRRHDQLVLMGQDIAEYGGVFKITDGFLEEFGPDRVRNTPLCESAIVGIGIGMGLEGYKSMVEMQFADFVTCAFNQIVNNAAKLHYRWGQNVDMVIRMPTGAGTGAGPFHSQSNEAWFAHVPGLKVVYPSSPEDAKGLLISSFEDPNPVLYFEHKALYRSIRDEVPVGYYTTPLGKARTVRRGDDLSVITYGMGVHWALKAVDELEIDAEIVDLRTLLPLDREAIAETVRHTHKALILHEDTLYGGLGGEWSAFIGEELFEYLDAPVLRVGSLDSPVPFAGTLEDDFLPGKRLKAALERLIKY